VANDEQYMRAALEQAALAETAGEVPVGAVLVSCGEIIARGHNRNLLDTDPSAHAEMVVLREAARRLKNHRLGACELFVTMEPCAMCAGAIVHARVARLVYGADDPKAVVSGVLADECGGMVRQFFRKRRAVNQE
jgi:tRNA(adenine34) deaminase